MFGWDYNEKILKDYLTNHAQDMGRLCAEILYAAPKAYSDFIVGFTRVIWEKEHGSTDRRRPSEEGINTDGAGK